MRNAEKHVAQGKIRAAITEYRSVVDHDPRDITTLNMLGDLYVKNSEKKEAVECYLKVADHFSTQGFAQKAIAIYNKITKLQPDSVEVSAKLAELYKVKGALNEARSHYVSLADHYERSGRRIEALSMWKQIAQLDPNDCDVCINLANSYVREGQPDEAVEAFVEAGNRLSRAGRFEDAAKIMMRGLEVRDNELRLLTGVVNAYSEIGGWEKAVSLLDEILENEPYNRDALYLLIDCHLKDSNAEGAEKAVTRLIELEPANYPKLLDLVKLYIDKFDLDAAARLLTMCSEFLLAAGDGDECHKWIKEILERRPDHVPTLRLLVRYTSWAKEEDNYRTALDRMAKAAKMSGLYEDEYFALKQIVNVRPHDVASLERLHVLKAEHNFDEEEEKPVESGRDAHNAADLNSDTDESFTSSQGDEDCNDVEALAGDGSEDVASEEFVDPEVIDGTGDTVTSVSHADEQRLSRELESIDFYVDNGYKDLADKALTELENEFGHMDEIAALRAKMNGAEDAAEVENDVIEVELGNSAATQTVESVEEIHTAEIFVEDVAASQPETLGINDIRSEFGIDEAEKQVEEADFETPYQTAVVYMEMGMTDEAIRLFQEAISLASIDDGTRRFFQCATLLGHCFNESGHPKLAVTWYERALGSNDLSDEERQGLWYELANALEADGQNELANQYFQRVYTENVDFRDVASRVRSPATLH